MLQCFCPDMKREPRAFSADALGRCCRLLVHVQLPSHLLHEHEVLGPPIPASAWRRTLEYGTRDASFVHFITPYFHQDGFVLMMVRRELAPSEQAQRLNLSSCSDLATLSYRRRPVGG